VAVSKCDVCGKRLLDREIVVCTPNEGGQWVEAWGDIRRPFIAATHASCFVERRGLAAYNGIISETLAGFGAALNEAVIRLAEAEGRNVT
jgi:hypothetical protein